MVHRHLHQTAARFSTSETGAVTVDWVVLCAVVTALTVSMYDEVADALGIHSDIVSEELTNSEIVRVGDENKVGFEFTEGNAGRWSGATVTDIPGFGEALGPIGGSNGYQTVGHDFIMASNVDQSIIQFDIYALDSLDNEAGVIYINGEEVGRLVVGHTTIEYIPTNSDGIVSDAVVVAQNVDLGGYVTAEDQSEEYWNDDIVTVAIAIDDPGDVLSFGFGSTANQDTSDEAFAIDNFVISGVNTEAMSDDGGSDDTGNGNGNGNGLQDGHGQGNDGT